jgi:hypothetical protein
MVKRESFGRGFSDRCVGWGRSLVAIGNRGKKGQYLYNVAPDGISPIAGNLGFRVNSLNFPKREPSDRFLETSLNFPEILGFA